LFPRAGEKRQTSQFYVIIWSSYSYQMSSSAKKKKTKNTKKE
jgi:hypothetical protein